jgi:hypothetical protein
MPPVSDIPRGSELGATSLLNDAHIHPRQILGDLPVEDQFRADCRWDELWAPPRRIG